MPSAVAVILELIKLIPSAIDAARDIAHSNEKSVQPRVWGRRHLWQYYKASVANRLDVPWCFYCNADQTQVNKNELCPGPSDWK